jgi:4-diphosphocytidyl-2-C-methyl-D-erythritol kinase
MPNCTLSAPAKINLNLLITGKRPDGFHELDTLMVRTSLTDTLHTEVTPTSTDSVTMTCSDPTLPVDQNNLVVRAARLFLETVPHDPCDVRVRLEKHIPSGGGLGGGSSDAAATLLALNQLTGSSCSEAELRLMAGKLGSDIPFFIGPPAARCRGRGEIIEPLDPAQQAALPQRAILVNPGFGVPTPEAYKTFAALPPDQKQGRVRGNFGWGILRNDLEAAVLPKYLWIAEAIEWLAARPEVEGAMMSGSGATVFALLREDAKVLQLELEFRKLFGIVPFLAEVALG